MAFKKGTLDGNRYENEILSGVLLPFCHINKLDDTNSMYLDDNAPAHRKDNYH